jgi:hypothetical protein
MFIDRCFAAFGLSVESGPHKISPRRDGVWSMEH